MVISFYVIKLRFLAELEFTNHQISFADAKIGRSHLVLAGVSLYIGFA
ncbi:hypothetical protein LC608_32915 [Nostoc sp. XA010]|nr:hypothetical protein [Nostoc sp. XA010]MCC5661664.1 hypothetical protein [Nostoc sp. XA010]